MHTKKEINIETKRVTSSAGRPKELAKKFIGMSVI
jgi:hypothetical protein